MPVADAAIASSASDIAGRGHAGRRRLRLTPESAEEVELRYMPEGGDAVHPTNFLSFRVRTAGIADRHFIYTGVSFCQARRDLRLEAESIRGQLGQQRARQLSPNGLVTGLHVGEVDVRQHVAVPRQPVIADGVPVIEHAVRPAEEAGTEGGVGAPVED